MSILKDKVPVGFCSDHAGYEMKTVIEGYFDSMGIEFKDFGTYSADSCDYADFAHPCALAVSDTGCSGIIYNRSPARVFFRYGARGVRHRMAY